MEDILASIRRIMADDDVPPAAARPAPDRAARPAPAERRRPDAPEPGSDAAERPARRGEPRIQDPHDAGHREGPARPAAGDGQMRARARIDLEELSEHLTSETQAGELPESDPHDIPQSASGHPFHGPAMNGQMPQEPPGRERGRAPEAAPRVVREFERRGAGPSEPERFEASPPPRAARPAERPAPEFRPGPRGEASPRGEARAPQVARRAAPPVAEEPAGMDAQPETDDRGDAVRRRDLLSPNVDDVVAAAFQSLGDLLLPQKQRTIEDLVKEILRPMLKDWLDQNLPSIVERLVRAEIERVARRPR